MVIGGILSAEPPKEFGFSCKIVFKRSSGKSKDSTQAAAQPPASIFADEKDKDTRLPWFETLDFGASQ